MAASSIPNVDEQGLIRSLRPSVFERPGFQVTIDGIVDRLRVSAAFRAGLAGEDQALVLRIHASTLGRDPEFVVHLGDEAARNGIDLHRVVVVVSEFIRARALLTGLGGLRDIGVRLGVEGPYPLSGVALLVESRPDSLWLDPAAARGAHADHYRLAVLESLALLSQRVPRKPVALGVEDVRDLDTLRAVGIGYAEGPALAPNPGIPDFAAR